MGDKKPRDYSMKFKENIDFLDALLADLQAIPIGGGQKTTRDPTDAPPPLPKENGTSRNTASSLGSNLSELDSLLEDLNTTTQPKGNKVYLGLRLAINFNTLVREKCAFKSDVVLFVYTNTCQN